jgi:YHS domain-containing protein
MGNAVECKQCCAEEKKNEVDVSVPSYHVHSSYVLNNQDGPALGAKTPTVTPRYDELPKAAAVSEMQPWGSPVQERGPLEPPVFGGFEQQAAQLPAGGSPQAPDSGRSLGGTQGGRSAVDWAADQEQFKHLKPLPEGWIRVTSRSTGAIYYCCQETGETTFVEPTAAQAVTKNNDLPAGWVEMTSKSTGKVYYWHAATQKSQFEKPTAQAAVAPVQGNDNEGLPPGWVSMVSRSTGKTYYHHATLQKSQFDRPTS